MPNPIERMIDEACRCKKCGALPLACKCPRLPDRPSRAERRERLLLMLNACGPMGMTELYKACDLTKGEAEPLVRSDSTFVRVGKNDSSWAAARVSSLWDEELEGELGKPRLGRDTPAAADGGKE